MTRIAPVASQTTRRTIRTTLTGVGVGCALLATVACAGADSTGPSTVNKNVTGLYALWTINKKPIPFQIFRGRYYYAPADYTFDDLTITVTGGELILEENGQFHLAVDIEFAANGEQQRGTRSTDGRYKVSGDEITLIDDNGSVTGPLMQDFISVNLDPGATGRTNAYFFKYTP